MKTVVFIAALAVFTALITYTAASSYMNYGYGATISSGAVRSTWGGTLSAAPQVLPCSGNVAPYCTFNMTDTKYYAIGYGGNITASAAGQMLFRLNGANWQTVALASGVNSFSITYFPSQVFSLSDKIELWYNGTSGTVFTPSNAVFRGFFLGFTFLATEVSGARSAVVEPAPHSMLPLLEAM